MKKLIAIGLLAICLSTMMVGCGDMNNSATDSAKSTEGTEATDTPATTDDAANNDTTTDDAAADDNNDLSEDMKEGVDDAADGVNDAIDSVDDAVDDATKSE